MSDAANLKNALVASLFQLSNAAQNTAAATVNLVNFYNSGETSTSSESLNKLAETLISVNGSTAALASAGDTASQAVASLTEKRPKSAEDALTESLAHDIDAVAAAAGVKPNGHPAKKKPKVEKDPNAPKKPLTMYFAYSFDIREKLKEDRKRKGLEPLSAVAMNDIIKEKWASITSEEKDKWQKKYQQEYGEYQKLKDAYDATKKIGAIATAIESLPADVDTDILKVSKSDDGEDEESKKSKKRKDGEKAEKKPKKVKK